MLGIDRSATDKEVSGAFRKEMLKYHPDTQPNASEAQKRRSTERSKLVSEAYRKIKAARKDKSSPLGATGRRGFSTLRAVETNGDNRAFLKNYPWLRIYQNRSRCVSEKRGISSTFMIEESEVSIEDFKTKSAEELKATIVEVIRKHEPPSRAQRALEFLKLQSKQILGVSDIETSLMDYWVKHQAALLEETKDVMTDPEKYELLTDAYEAAVAVDTILNDMGNPSSHHYVASLKTWATTCEMAHNMGLKDEDVVIGVPQRTQHILAQQPNPSVDSYNQVIRAWAYSSEYLRGTMAEQVFDDIDFPNGESFRMIIRAHSMSNEGRAAFQATGHFMRMMRLLEIGKDDMRPSSLEDYRLLCHAWTDARDRNAPSKVYSLLNIMDMVYRKELTDLRPDTDCYRSALQTMSRKHLNSDVGELVDELLKEMKENNVFPDAECYRAAIVAFKNMASLKESTCREEFISRAYQLLQEMVEEYHRTTLVTVQATTDDYNHVLAALSLSADPKAADRAENLLEALRESEGFSGGPIPTTFRFVLESWCRSRSFEKLDKASRVLDELILRAETVTEWFDDPRSREDLVDAFSAFIRVCGTVGSSNRNTYGGIRIMKKALESVKSMRQMGLAPNAGTYAALIDACDHLLPREERQDVLEGIFRRACDEGYVDATLLAKFRTVATSYLYTKVVVANSELVEDTKTVPQSWTRNVPGYKDGKKNTPLSIHGAYTFTRTAADYRARNLRHRTNQRVLQGGRMK